MADVRQRLPANIEGEFFVDATCINCDACRQLAPETFDESGDFSFVFSQPQTEAAERRALRALLACPTGSIGTLNRNNAKQVASDFPLHLEDGVYYCGFNSPKSYGGSSYLIKHPDGNWLIDSPKFLPQLIRRFRELGGIRYIFLTHRDDVAEAGKYAHQFESRRIIHRSDLSAEPEAEIVLEGDEPSRLAPEFLVVPTPGHTRGHCVLNYKDRFLFTGDHLRWSRTSRRLTASRSTCWHSWTEQTKSMAKLLGLTFEWVLPGHGQSVNLPADGMHQELSALVQRMQHSP
jgi:glyoxylase-like metal-dependent hydrolase (beta-lactamase superfamily II)/ferredoxin